MPRAIGFSRNLKLSWLNKAASMFGEKLSEEQFKSTMNEYLAFEISSPINIRKTRELLMHLWYYQEDTVINSQREVAYRLLLSYPEYDCLVHWCMLLLVFPVFVDLCKQFGRIADFNETVLLKQLKEKLFDLWGERSTLFHSIDKIVATMKDLGSITADRKGTYRICLSEVKNENLVLFLIKTAMILDGSSYYSLNDLNSFYVLFPFKYEISKEAVMNQNDFAFSNFGGELTLALKQKTNVSEDGSY